MLGAPRSVETRMPYYVMLFRPAQGQDPLALAKVLWDGGDDDSPEPRSFSSEERERLMQELLDADPRLRPIGDDAVRELAPDPPGGSAEYEVSADSVLAVLPDAEAEIDRAIATLRALARRWGLLVFDAERDALVDLEQDADALRRAALDDARTREVVACTNLATIRGGTIGMLVTILAFAAVAFALARPENRAYVLAAVPLVVLVATIMRLVLVRRRLRGK
jgi:hypothetical protein